MKRKIVIAILAIIMLSGTRVSADLTRTRRAEIIEDYVKVLKNRRYSAGKESDLSETKELIRKALIQELSDPTDRSLVSSMEIAYLELETFISDGEFEVIRKHEEEVNHKKANIPGVPPHVDRDSAHVISQTPNKYAAIRRKILEKQNSLMEELKRLRERDATSQDIYFLPEIECHLVIPSGFRKADQSTLGMIENLRMSVCPESMSQDEKKRNARLASVFYKELDDIKLPVRPFFTLQIRDVDRQLTHKDFETQVSILKEMAANQSTASGIPPNFRLIDYIMTQTPLVNSKNHSVIMSHVTTSSYGNAEGYFLIQSFNYYRRGILIISFYSDITEIRENIKDLETIFYSARFTGKAKW